MVRNVDTPYSWIETDLGEVKFYTERNPSGDSSRMLIYHAVYHGGQSSFSVYHKNLPHTVDLLYRGFDKRDEAFRVLEWAMQIDLNNLVNGLPVEKSA